MFKLEYDGSKDSVALRDALANELCELFKKDENVMYLDSDLASSMGMAKAMTSYPKQAIDCGVQEANMVGVACGLAAVGKTVFAHSFGIFASRRCFDQVFLSAAYAKNSLRLIGSDEGITAEYNGGTHMPFEDMSLMRAIPDSRVIDITDCAVMRDTIKQVAALEGFTYIRTARKSSVKIYGEGSTFEIGKGNLLRDGSDVTLIACGIMVADCLQAAEALEKEGINAAVIDMFTVKPLDEELTVAYAKKTGAIVTAENHNVTGGLGSAVCETLSEKHPVPVERIGARERFGQVGTIDYLRQQYGMRVEDIVLAAKRAIARK